MIAIILATFCACVFVFYLLGRVRCRLVIWLSFQMFGLFIFLLVCFRAHTLNYTVYFVPDSNIMMNIAKKNECTFTNCVPTNPIAGFRCCRYFGTDRCISMLLKIFIFLFVIFRFSMSNEVFLLPLTLRSLARTNTP